MVKELTWENATCHAASFISSPETFKKSQRGYPYIDKFPFRNKQLIGSNEIIYEDLIYNLKIKGSKVLIIGGGPTTNDCDWDETKYDLVFSCNHFFLHPRIKNMEVHFVTLSDEVPLFSAELTEYMQKYTTMFCFENCGREIEQKRGHLPKAFTDLKKFYPKYTDRCMLASLRYLSKIGATPRLLVIASLFAASEIHVVGMDGYPPGARLGQDSNHAFQVGKKMKGTYKYENFLQQYDALWRYVKGLSPETKFVNLGQGHPYNMSTLIWDEVFNETQERDNVCGSS